MFSTTLSSWLGFRKDQPQKPQRSGHTQTCAQQHTRVTAPHLRYFHKSRGRDSHNTQNHHTSTSSQEISRP
jgi:hypothetical protein